MPGGADKLTVYLLSDQFLKKVTKIKNPDLFFVSTNQRRRQLGKYGEN